jgi:hypothetical protein
MTDRQIDSRARPPPRQECANYLSLMSWDHFCVLMLPLLIDFMGPTQLTCKVPEAL